MNAQQTIKELKKREKQIQQAFQKRLPRKIGAKVVNLVKRNFREGGFNDGGLHPWKKTRRQETAKGAEGKYGPLLSKRNHLSRSTEYIAEPYKVTIQNAVEYASIHNDGGDIETHPKVTTKMRKMAWRMYFKEAGITKEMEKEERKDKAKNASDEAKKWKGIALTKKQQLDVKANIPQRKFIGSSQDSERITREEVMKELTRIMNK